MVREIELSATGSEPSRAEPRAALLCFASATAPNLFSSLLDPRATHLMAPMYEPQICKNHSACRRLSARLPLVFGWLDAVEQSRAYLQARQDATEVRVNVGRHYQPAKAIRSWCSFVGRYDPLRH